MTEDRDYRCDGLRDAVVAEVARVTLTVTPGRMFLSGVGALRRRSEVTTTEGGRLRRFAVLGEHGAVGFLLGVYLGPEAGKFAAPTVAYCAYDPAIGEHIAAAGIDLAVHHPRPVAGVEHADGTCPYLEGPCWLVGHSVPHTLIGEWAAAGFDDEVIYGALAGRYVADLVEAGR